MDPATATAAAALVVAVLAMIVALSQALQQYFITGQLIRICDKVVFGKMPGRGRRVWETAQLRFRVVYSLPQVSLDAELWPRTSPHVPSYAKANMHLPDLRVPIPSLKKDPKSEHTSPQEPRSYFSVVPGEASWVSFCRAVQLSSGGSMLLELVEGDSDRCPSDLPTVPMQMSMRDIATLALRAGMVCTDASFQRKSLSMQGSVGTVTTSQHPVLGPLVHFSPRNIRDGDEIHCLQVGEGKVSPSWMARMWGDVIIAGRRYNGIERRQIEMDEAMWAEQSRELAIIPARKTSSPAGGGLRRRRFRSPKNVPDQSAFRAPLSSNIHPPTRGNSTGWRRYDGKWYLDGVAPEPNTHSPSVPLSDATQTAGDPKRLHAPRLQPWHRRFLDFFGGIFRRNGSRAQDSTLSPRNGDIEKGRRGKEKCTSENPADQVLELNGKQAVNGPPAAQPSRPDDDTKFQSPASRNLGPELQPRWFIKEYIEEKWKERENQKDQRSERRLIGWYDDKEDEMPGTDRYSSRRNSFYAQRWLDIVKERQMLREERSTSRGPRRRTKSSTSWSTGSYSRGQSITSRTTQRSEGLFSTDGRSSRRGTSQSSAQSRRPRRQTFRSEDDFNLRQGSGHSTGRLRSDMHGRTDHFDGMVEYGSGPIERNQYPETAEATVSKERLEDTGSKMDASGTRSAPAHVGFNRKIHVIRHSPSVSVDGSLYAPTESTEPAEEISHAAGQEETLGEPPVKLTPPLKGMLQKGRGRSPQVPERPPGSELPADNASRNAVSPGEQWTKIKRAFASPAALEEAGEIYHVTQDEVVVHRYLTREEIQAFAVRTAELRGYREIDSKVAIEVKERQNTDGSSQQPRGRRRERSYSPELSGDESVKSLHSGHFPKAMEQASSGVAKTKAHARIASPRGGETARLLDEMAIPSSYDKLDTAYGRQIMPEELVVESPVDMSDDEEQRQKRPRTWSYVRSSGQRFLHKSPFARQFHSRKPYEEPRSYSDGEAEYRAKNEARFGNIYEEQEPGYDQPEEPDFDELNDLDDPEDVRNPHDNTTKDEHLGKTPWFWICQMDTTPGYFATPWTDSFSLPVCFGAIATILQAISELTGSAQPTYIKLDSFSRSLNWMREGESTFPPYAINARHGTIISGDYKAVHIPGFHAPLFPLELLNDYGYQVDRSQPSNTATTRARLAELMALDSWLSHCGRQPEISGDSGNSSITDLQHTMPALVQRMMDSFEFEFANLDRTAVDGGFQIVKEVAQNLLGTLSGNIEGLSPAETTFALVAMLRAAKMALCVVQGTDTSDLREILMNDVQVHLV